MSVYTRARWAGHGAGLILTATVHPFSDHREFYHHLFLAVLDTVYPLYSSPTDSEQLCVFLCSRDRATSTATILPAWEASYLLASICLSIHPSVYCFHVCCITDCYTESLCPPQCLCPDLNPCVTELAAGALQGAQVMRMGLSRTGPVP